MNKAFKLVEENLQFKNYVKNIYAKFGGQNLEYKHYKMYCDMLDIESRISSDASYLLDDMLEYSLAFVRFQNLAAFLREKTSEEKYLNFSHDICKFLMCMGGNKNNFYYEGKMEKIISQNPLKLEYFANIQEVYDFFQQEKFAWMLPPTEFEGLVIPGIPVYFVNNMEYSLSSLGEREFQNLRGDFEEEVAINSIVGLFSDETKKFFNKSYEFSNCGTKGEIDLILETQKEVFIFEVKTQSKIASNWNIDNHKFSNFQKGIKQLDKAKKFLKTKTNKKIYKVLVTNGYIDNYDFIQKCFINEVSVLEIKTIIKWSLSKFMFEIDKKTNLESIYFLLKTPSITGNKTTFLSKVVAGKLGEIKTFVNSNKQPLKLMSRGNFSAGLSNSFRKWQEQEGIEKFEEILSFFFKTGNSRIKNSLKNPDI